MLGLPPLLHLRDAAPVGMVCAFAGQVSSSTQGESEIWSGTSCASGGFGGFPSSAAVSSPLDSANPVILIEALGWMLCDGRSLEVAKYPLLFGVLGYLYGEGSDGEGTFRIPDYRGLFLRGVDDGAGIDPGERTGPAGSDQSDGVGSLECDAMQDHTHLYAVFDQAVEGVPPDGAGQPNTQLQETGSPIEPGSSLTHPPDGTAARLSSETRPRNIAVNYIIKYRYVGR